MTFFEAFEKIKKSIKFETAPEIEGHLALQLNITDEDAGGICYVEVNDGRILVEPYDYRDNDWILWASTEDFCKVFSGRLGVERALKEERLKITGNVDRAMEFRKFTKKIARGPQKKA
jgi:putative sterol carrier protein